LVIEDFTNVKTIANNRGIMAVASHMGKLVARNV
jgi:hypothetical protein